MKQIKHFLAFFITVTMIVSGGGLDGFAALSYATENQDEPAVTQERDTESAEQDEAAAPDQDIVSEDQIEPEDSEEAITDVKDSDESEDPVETESDGTAFTELSTSIKTSDDSKWKVAAVIPDGAGIPENAELIIEEIEEQDYDGYLEESAKALKWESTDRVGYARFLNISFISKGKTIEPSKKVEFTISSEDVKKNIDTMQVVCFGDDQLKNKEKAEELICEVTENDELVFRTDTMGVFGFLTLDEISLTKKTLKKGNVTLKGMMPEDAKLETSDEVKAKAVKALAKKKEDTALAAYDITIRSEGEEYQPDADHPIQVQIANEAIKKDSNLSVWHLKDDGTKEQVKDFKVADGSISFEADGFSVYVIIEHEDDDEVITPRVEFHYISGDFDETSNPYTAPAYQFLNKHNEKQVSQILTDGESLEKIANPPNKKDSEGKEKSFFYGWYTVDMVSDETTYSEGEWSGDISYNWPESDKIFKVNDETPLTIAYEGTPVKGSTVTWTMGDASGTAELDSEGTAHVYLAPLYENYQFVNFHMGSKESEPGLRNNLLARRVLVFGLNNTTTARIGNVVGPSPDPAHQIFAGWETVTKNNGTLETDVYYQTLDQENNERNVIAAVDGTETPTESGGYWMTVQKSNTGLSSVDLYPVFAEARWLYYDLGKSGNGAVYVPAQYRLTNDDEKGTYFTSLSTTSRAGYTFEGWYTAKDSDGNGAGIQLTDASGAFVSGVLGKTFYGVYSIDDQGVKTLESISTEETSGSVKIFDITADGKMYFYKGLESLTVHAKWEKETVKYTVVYWLENANDSEYSLMYYKVLQGESGAQTEAEEAKETDTFVREGVTYYPYEEYKLRFAHLSTDQDKETAGNQSGIQQQEIAGNGSTIVNVYYDRNVYRLRFDIGFARRTSTSGSSATYEPMTAQEAASYSGTVYGAVDGSYIELVKDVNGKWIYEDSENGKPYGIVNSQYVPLTISGTETVNVYKPQYTYSSTTTDAEEGLYGIDSDGNYVELEGTETITPGDTYYILTSTITSGNEYLIVTRNNQGSGFAFGRNGTNYKADAVTVNSGIAATGNSAYISSRDADNTTIWTVESSGNYYKFQNDGYYIKGNNNALTISTGNNNNTWSWGPNTIRYRNGNLNGNYLRKRDQDNNFSLRNNSGNIYLYEKTDTLTSSWAYKIKGTDTVYTGTRYTQANNDSETTYPETDSNVTTHNGELCYHDTAGIYGAENAYIPVVEAGTEEVNEYTYSDTAYTGTVYSMAQYTGTLYKQTTLSGTWQYSVSNITGPNYADGNTWDQWLTGHRIDLGTTNPFGPGEYNGTYETTVNNTPYIVYYYELEAKYGETIMDRYPGTQSQKTGAGAFVGWLAQRDSYYNGRLSTSIKGTFETLTEDLILTGGTIPRYNSKISNIDPNDYVAITVNDDNTITNEHGITQEFRCRYNTTSDSYHAYLYRMYLADPETQEYSSEPTYKSIVVGGGGSHPNLQTAPTFQGYTIEDTKVLTSATDTTGVAPSDRDYDYPVTELIEAGINNNSAIMVFKYQPNLHHISYKYGSGAPEDKVNTEFSIASKPYYYGQSLSEANVNENEAVEATPKGHNFIGWFDNPDGVGNRFDFNSTMQDSDIVLYAVYKPIEYMIKIDPNGAEIDHIDHNGDEYSGSATPLNRAQITYEDDNHNTVIERPADSGYNKSQSTYFFGDYGETVGEYAVSRSFVPIGDRAAEIYTTEENRHVYAYVNIQYVGGTIDGEWGVPTDLHDALYVDATYGLGRYVNDDPAQGETELYTLYKFYHDWVVANKDARPDYWDCDGAYDISFEA